MGLTIVVLLMITCNIAPTPVVIVVTATMQPTSTLLPPTATSTPVPPTLTATHTPTATPSETPTPFDTATMTPEPIMGVVHGVLIDKNTGQPVLDVRVALGLVEYDENGAPTRYEVSTDRMAHTDDTGAFAIEAQPGTYVIVSPGGSPLDKIARDDAGAALLVEVMAGQTVDVGKIQISP